MNRFLESVLILINCLLFPIEMIVKTVSFLVFSVLFNHFKVILGRIRRNFLIIVKFLLFILLFCSAVSMTFDYLSYPYIYKLIVSDNNRGFDLPAISFCTERNVFFDKNKINEYFNSSEEYKRYEEENENNFKKRINKCFYSYMRRNMSKHIHYCDRVQYEKNYNLSLFYRPYEEKIFGTLSFDEMKNLTISANELFNCSAKLHFRNESFVSNATIIENCFDRFEVLQSIYGNEFGICYTFFPKNYRYFSQKTTTL